MKALLTEGRLPLDFLIAVFCHVMWNGGLMTVQAWLVSGSCVITITHGGLAAGRGAIREQAASAMVSCMIMCSCTLCSGGTVVGLLVERLATKWRRGVLSLLSRGMGYQGGEKGNMQPPSVTAASMANDRWCVGVLAVWPVGGHLEAAVCPGA